MDAQTPCIHIHLKHGEAGGLGTQGQSETISAKKLERMAENQNELQTEMEKGNTRRERADAREEVQWGKDWMKTMD